MQSYLTRPPLQPIQRPSGSFGVPNAAAVGRTLYVPQRSGVVMHMHNFDNYGLPNPHTTQSSAYAGPTQAMFAQPQPHMPNYQPHSFTPPAITHAPRHKFPVGPFVITVIVCVLIAGAYAGYRAATNPPPANAAPVLYSK